jgi:hypothetical protein
MPRYQSRRPTVNSTFVGLLAEFGEANIPYRFQQWRGLRPAVGDF